MISRIISGVFLLACASLVAGCLSYTIVQRNVFADDDGNVTIVDYGRSEKNHVNTFVSPTTGKEMEFESKLMLRVTLPDGDTIKAWQCMNFLSQGTMYRTDNDEWMVLVAGFSCTVYKQTEEDDTRYLEVFRGVLCDSPEVEVQKDDRWKPVARGKGGTYSKEQSK